MSEANFPREAFRQAPARLQRLLDVTEGVFRLVYVDGNASSSIARRILGLIAPPW